MMRLPIEFSEGVTQVFIFEESILVIDAGLNSNWIHWHQRMAGYGVADGAPDMEGSWKYTE
jgi:hypothetical protein